MSGTEVGIAALIMTGVIQVGAVAYMFGSMKSDIRNLGRSLDRHRKASADRAHGNGR